MINYDLQSWDDDIALVAQTYAENCVFEHDDSYKRMIPGKFLKFYI